MPVARFEMPDGRIARFEVPEGTTPEEAQALMEAQAADLPAPTPVEPAGPPQEKSIVQSVKNVFNEAVGAVETGVAIGSSIAAEGAAGVAGIGTGIIEAARRPTERVGEFQPKGGNIAPIIEKGTEEAPIEAAVGAIDATREALTFKPRTDEGQRNLKVLGDKLRPAGELVTKAEGALGDKVMAETGSPLLAGIATAIPTAAADLLTFGAAKTVTGTVKAVNRASKVRAITKEIAKAAPDSKQLRSISNSLFKEVDEAGILVNQNAFLELTVSLGEKLRKAGLDPDVTPAASAVLRRLENTVGTPLTLSELNTLRKVAQGAAKKIDNPTDSALGIQIIDDIDEFVNNARPGRDLIGPQKAVSEVGGKLNLARDLWGRAKRSEMVQEAFAKAEIGGSGFENGLRVQFRSILNNPKKKKFLTAEEIKVMESFVSGTKGQNLAKFVGRFGAFESGSTSAIGSSAGAAGGAFLGATIAGPIGGLIGFATVPAIGQVSKSLALKLTRNSANFADQVIRAGKDGRKITRAYMKAVKKADRNPAELAELLARPDVAFKTLPKSAFVEQATRIALENRALAVGALGAGEIIHDDLPPEVN